MPYVMVPVPEELEEEVAQYVMRLSLSAALNRWDIDAVRRILDGVDDLARSIIVAMARSCAAQDEVTDRSVAERFGITPSEVVDVAMQVNAVCQAVGSPALLLMGSDFEEDEHGEKHLVRRFVVGTDPARLVLDVEHELSGR